MGVCLVIGGKSHYSGLCRFGVQDVKTTIEAYVRMSGIRVKIVEIAIKYMASKNLHTSKT